MLSGFSKPPWEFSEEDLQEVVELKTPEGLHWDYKCSGSGQQGHYGERSNQGGVSFQQF